MNKLLASIFLILFTFSFIVKAKQAGEYYEEALILVQRGELNTAEIAVKNSIKEDGKYLPARLLLGKILLEKGSPAAAEKELTISLSLYADHQAVILPLTKTKALLSKHQEVLDLLIKYPQLATEKDYYLVQSRSYKALNNYSEAESSLDKSINIHGESEQALTGMAELYLLQAKLTLADKFIQQALSINAEHIPAQMLQAEIFKKQGSLQQAIAVYDLILAKDDQDQQALFGKTHVLIKQNKLPEALQLCLLLREKFPHDPYAKLLHVSIVALNGDYKKSKLLLRDIQNQLSALGDKKQKEREVLLLSASVDLMNDNLNQARRQFAEYISLYGESVIARRNLATIAFKQQNLSSARAHIDKALKIAVNDADLYLLATQIVKLQGTNSEYIELVKKSYALFASNPQIKAQYIGVLIAINDIEQAVSILEKSDDMVNQTLLGYLQLQSNQLEKSLMTTQKLLNEQPNKVEILQLAGELSLQLGRKEDAEMFFQQTLVLAPQFKPALLALAGMALNSHDSEKTEQYYQEILTYDPEDSLVLQLYANFAIQHQQPYLAIKLLMAIHKGAESFFDAQRALLALYMQTNQADLANEILTGLEERFSFDQELLLAKSELQIQAKQLSAAEKTLKILFGLVYDNATKLESVAMLQLDINDLVSAQASVARIEQLSANKVNPYILARLKMSEKDFEHVAKIIKENLSKASVGSKKNLAWYELQVHLFINKGDIVPATTHLEALFSQTQQRSHMQLLASLYTQLNQNEKVIKLLVTWLSVQNRDAWAVGQLSEIALKNHQADVAIAALESYPLLNQQPIFLNNLANLYLATDLNKAIVYAKTAYDLLPSVAAINDTLGWALVLSNEYQQGLSYLREATARDVNNADYQYHLAFSLAKLKRIELARLAFAKAEKLNINHKLQPIVTEMLISNENL
ncbi:MAG: putative PEP-CTERM system TPR-repeat lipoprotein [Alteromonadaceae bacterium]|jgi:putative PEP-CTERM system TPR-repeat lipoprotein